MADEGVRKSGRVRTRTSYLEDDFEYDYDLHLDISSDISSILESHKQPKIKTKEKHGKAGSSVHNAVKQAVRKEQLIDPNGNKVVKSEGQPLPEIEANSFIIQGLHFEKFSCPVCKRNLTSDKELEEHLSKHQTDSGRVNGGYVCDICNRICVDEGAFNRHMKSHSGDRKFKCDICDKAFAESCSLKRHMKTHDDDRPFICDFCFKTFRDHPSLIRHHKTHTERPRMYQCSQCDKNFAEKHGLKRHERSHTGIRPFECQICFKAFSESGSFKRHQKIHTGIRNYFCAVCNKSFLEKQSLLRHQKNVCGLAGGILLNHLDVNGLIDLEQSQDSAYSAADHSEMSQASLDEEDLKGLNRQSSTDTDIKPAVSTTVKSDAFISPVVVHSDTKPPVKEESCKFSKEAPSLHSLIKKDPNLYDSISEIVESIDSYEKMLDLCGDQGQKELDAALTREPVPMPENLLCFECGELLVDGENFKSEGKSFHASLTHSYKCLSCEKEEEDYGEPPVLTAEIPTADPHMEEETAVSESNQGQELKDKVAESKTSFTNNDSNGRKKIFGTDESIEHFRERLKTQHGVCFIGDAFGNTGYGMESESHSQLDLADSSATASRSDSTESEVACITGACISQQTADGSVGQESLQGNSSTPHNPAHPESCVDQSLAIFHVPDPLLFQQDAGNWNRSSPKMEYEADAPNIPSVFPCHLCTKVFATSTFLSRHLELHKKSPYRCMVCNKTFTNSPNLKRHMTTHTGEKPYTCPHCHKSIRDPSNFSKHKKLCSASSVTPSPVDSGSSASSVSPVQSTDDSDLTGNGVDAGPYMTDLKQKLSFPSNPVTTPVNLSSHDMPIRFSYDDDEDEALPVTFGPIDGESNCLSSKKKTKGGKQKDNLSNQDHVHGEPEDKTLLIPCPICGKTFGSEQYLEMHMKYHFGDASVTCIECGKSFADPFGLKRHMRIHAGVRPHICEYCQRGYCDNWSLKKHKSRGCVLSEIKVPAESLHPCPQCNRLFSDLSYLQEHMTTHKGIPKYECDVCQKRFSEAFNLKRHRRLHMAVCSGCEREFKDIQSLTEHQTTECPANASEVATTNKLDGYPCPECGRVYSSKAYLERHKKFHSDLKPYVCEICNKKFSEGFRLRRHMKVHTGNKPFHCESCRKTFRDETSLKRHIAHTNCQPVKEKQGVVRHHSRIQDFPCQLCDKVFGKNYLLVRHMNVHSQERPFACTICDRSYKDTSSLRRHQLVHQGVKEFICPICGKDFFYSDSLRRHIAGSCGNPKSRRRRRGRGKKKSNNNISMINNNTIDKAVPISETKQQKPPVEKSSTTKISPAVSQTQYFARIPARNIKVSHWSCHQKQQCWRCNLKFVSSGSLLKHARIHQHKKPYHCPFCFMRWTQKWYLKQHACSHKSHSTPDDQSLSTQTSELQLKRPRRSIPRARWSWISQI